MSAAMHSVIVCLAFLGLSQAATGAGYGHGRGPEDPTRGVETPRTEPIPSLPRTVIPDEGYSGATAGDNRPSFGGESTDKGCPPVCPHIDFIPPNTMAVLGYNQVEDNWREGLRRLTAQHNIEAALKIVLSEQYIVLGEEYRRAVLMNQAIEELAELRQEVVALVVQELKTQIAATTPMFWDPREEARRKRRVAEQTTKKLDDIDHKDTSDFYRPPSYDRQTGLYKHGVIHYKPGESMQQLGNIAAKKCWGPDC